MSKLVQKQLHQTLFGQIAVDGTTAIWQPGGHKFPNYQNFFDAEGLPE
jgi:hypothetical protein